MYARHIYFLIVFLSIHISFYEYVYGLSGAFYADNGRGQSVLYKTLSRSDKTELQQEILQLLDLKQRPKRSLTSKYERYNFKESSSKKYLLRLYKAVGDAKVRRKFCRKNKSCMDLLAESDFIISYSNKIDDYSDLVHGMNNIFYFDVSNVNPEWELVKAELRIFRNVTDRNKIEKGKKFLVSLYTVLEDDYNIGSLELVEDFILSTKNSSGWLGFNITKALMKWIEFPLSNSGLRLKVKPVSDIEVPGYDISPHDIGIYTTNTPTEYRAFIVAYFKSASQQRLRTKRTPRRKQLNSSYMRGNYNPYRLTQERYVPKTRSCEKWALYVNFRDLGFEDWIIAPDGYAAFYCDGSCMFPLNAQMNATNHAIVQTLMHLMDPNGVPKPSCAPTQLSSITVLYFDDNSNVILKKYKNMVVKSCGCH